MAKRQLTNLRQQVNLGDSSFVVSSLTLEAKENLETLFDKEGYKYSDAINQIIENGNVNLCLLFVFGLIENNSFKDFKEFKRLAKKHLKPSELSTIIENVFIDSLPDYTNDTEKKNYLSGLTGLVIIISMIHLLISIGVYLYLGVSIYL